MQNLDYDISPDQVFLKRSASTQTESYELYHQAESIVKNYKKINQHWRLLQVKSYAICAFSLGLVIATVIHHKN